MGLNKNIFVVVLLVCLLLMTGFLFIKNLKVKEINRNYLINFREMKIELDDLNQIRLMEMQAENTLLDSVMVINKNNNHKSLEDIIKNNTLV